MSTTTKDKRRTRKGESARSGERAEAPPDPAAEGAPHPSTALLPTPASLVQSATEEVRGWLAGLATGEWPMRRSGPAAGGARRSALWIPPLELVREPDALVVRSELPGVKPADVHVTVEDHTLTIWGERREEERKQHDGVTQTERCYGAFARAIPLPGEAQVDDVSASLRDGVLEIRVPTPVRKPSQEIPVAS